MHVILTHEQADFDAVASQLGAFLLQENVFAVLIEAVRVCSLGQITDALFDAGGQYRRNM